MRPNYTHAEVFISYAHEDTEAVKLIAGFLRKGGVRVWMDDAIKSGRHWRKEIVDVITECEALVVCVSKAAITSDWVKIEIDMALGAGKPVIPILLEETAEAELSVLGLAGIQYVGYANPADESSLHRLCDALSGHGILSGKARAAARAARRLRRRLIYAAIATLGAAAALIGAAVHEGPVVRMDGMLKGHQGEVTCLAVSDNGSYALSGEGMNKSTGKPQHPVILWDLATRSPIHRFTHHTDWVRSVAISRDGALGLSGSGDKTVSVLDLKNKKVLHTFTNHAKNVIAVRFSQDESQALSVSWDNTIRSWSLKGLTNDGVFQRQHGITCIAMIPETRDFLFGGDDHNVHRASMNVTEVDPFSSQGGVVRAIAIAPDSSHAMSGGDDRTVRVRSLRTKKEEELLRVHTSPVRTLGFFPSGRRAFSGSEDGTVCFWNAHNWKLIGQISGEHVPKKLWAVAYVPKRDLLLVGGSSGDIFAWQVIRP